MERKYRMRKLNIGYFSDGIWGHNALKLLVSDDNFDIKFIIPRFQTEDVILEQMATKYNIEYFRHKNINTEKFLNDILEYNCDILVSMSFDQIFKPIILSKYRVINCHAGALPFYRGRNILNWVLINDEKEFGITAHYVDEGIDTGDIILQKTYPITDKDDYNTLLYKAQTECALALYDALKKIAAGDETVIKQDTIDKVRMYCGKRQNGDELINWNLTSRELFNFIRAICKPGPQAQTFLNHKKVYINSSEMISSAPVYKGIPGQVLYKDGNNIIVKTGDSLIKIIKYDCVDKIRIGDRFQNE